MQKGLKEKLDSGKEYFEIRLESIGGLGANLCGKMLGELGLKYLNVNSSSFSSYGSEKTGTPVKGYIRYCKSEKEIRSHAPVTEPDILVIFHKALLNDASVLKGVREDTVVIVALEDMDTACAECKMNDCGNFDVLHGQFTGIWYGLPAQKIAMETKSRINVVMLGAVLNVIGLESTEYGEKICSDLLGKKYPDALKANLEGMRRGFSEISKLTLTENKQGVGRGVNRNSDGAEHAGGAVNQKKHQAWGYETAPVGGINPNIGSTVIADLSPSRQGYIPLFIKEKCINCGLCYSTCPDMVFQFKKGEYNGKEMMINQGLDYYHCKGCLRCVAICPVNALVSGKESEHPKKEYFIPNQELLRRPEIYEKSGADGYITSESYLTEKRMEGGEV